MRRARSSTRDDFDRVKDSIHKLRTENRKLRRENSHLRKQLSRISDDEFDKQDEAEEELAGPSEIEEVPEEKPTCPKCKSDNYLLIPAGKYLIKACKACGFRKRTEAKAKA